MRDWGNPNEPMSFRPSDPLPEPDVTGLAPGGVVIQSAVDGAEVAVDHGTGMVVVKLGRGEHLQLRAGDRFSHRNPVIGAPGVRTLGIAQDHELAQVVDDRGVWMYVRLRRKVMSHETSMTMMAIQRSRKDAISRIVRLKTELEDGRVALEKAEADLALAETRLEAIKRDAAA